MTAIKTWNCIMLENCLHVCELFSTHMGFPGSSVSKESTCSAGDTGRHGFNPQVRKIPWRRAWQPTPVFLPGESHGQRNMVGYSPWGRKESDTTEVTEHTTHTCMWTQMPFFFHVFFSPKKILNFSLEYSWISVVLVSVAQQSESVVHV